MIFGGVTRSKPRYDPGFGMVCRSTGLDVEARADMNVTDKRGQTPLCLGAS